MAKVFNLSKNINIPWVDDFIYKMSKKLNLKKENDLNKNKDKITKLSYKEAESIGLLAKANYIGWNMYKENSGILDSGSIWYLETDNKTGERFLIKNISQEGEIVRRIIDKVKNAKKEKLELNKKAEMEKSKEDLKNEKISKREFLNKRLGQLTRSIKRAEEDPNWIPPEYLQNMKNMADEIRGGLTQLEKELKELDNKIKVNLEEHKPTIEEKIVNSKAWKSLNKQAEGEVYNTLEEANKKATELKDQTGKEFEPVQSPTDNTKFELKPKVADLKQGATTKKIYDELEITEEEWDNMSKREKMNAILNYENVGIKPHDMPLKEKEENLKQATGMIRTVDEAIEYLFLYHEEVEKIGENEYKLTDSNDGTEEIYDADGLIERANRYWQLYENKYSSLKKQSSITWRFDNIGNIIVLDNDKQFAYLQGDDAKDFLQYIPQDDIEFGKGIVPNGAEFKVSSDLNKQAEEINKTEIANLIYDTIMKNVGMSEHHIEFDINKVENQEIEGDTIKFTYDDKPFIITINETTKEASLNKQSDDEEIKKWLKQKFNEDGRNNVIDALQRKTFLAKSENKDVFIFDGLKSPQEAERILIMADDMPFLASLNKQAGDLYNITVLINGVKKEHVQQALEYLNKYELTDLGINPEDIKAISQNEKGYVASLESRNISKENLDVLSELLSDAEHELGFVSINLGANQVESKAKEQTPEKKVEKKNPKESEIEKKVPMEVSKEDEVEKEELNKNKKAKFVKQATGEADQDYDHEFFDAIVNELNKNKIRGATHKEFDKYRGVYLMVPEVDKFWIEDVYSRGKIRKEDLSKPFTHMKLINEEGEEVGGTRGDFFMLPNNKVLKGYQLILTKQDGTEEIIDNPTVAQIPDITELMDTFQYEENTRIEHCVFYPEDNPDIKLEVLDYGNGEIDASELIEYCKTKQ